MKAIIAICAVVCVTSFRGWGNVNEDEWDRFMAQGTAQDKAGQYAAAVASYHEAVVFLEHSGTNAMRLTLALNALGRANDELGHYLEAEGLYRQALAVVKKAGYAESPQYAVILGNLGSVLVETGQDAAGVAMLRDALAMHRRTLPPDDRRIAAICNGLSEGLLKEGKYREAEQRLNEAAAILEKEPQPGSELAITLSNLAVIWRERKQYEEAERLMERSMELFQNEVGPDHPLLVCGFNNLASLYNSAHHPDKADTTFQKALALAEKHLGTNHPTYGSVLQNYAQFLRANGRKAEAKTMQARSKDVLRRSASRNGLGMRVDVSTLRAK